MPCSCLRNSSPTASGISSLNITPKIIRLLHKNAKDVKKDAHLWASRSQGEENLAVAVEKAADERIWRTAQQAKIEIEGVANK